MLRRGVANVVEVRPQVRHDGQGDRREYPAEGVREDAAEERGEPGARSLPARMRSRLDWIICGHVIMVVLATSGSGVQRFGQLAAPSGRHQPVQFAGWLIRVRR
jgi:hypothetical protein